MIHALPMSSWEIFALLWNRYIKPHYVVLALGTFSMTLSGASTAMLTTYLKPLFDNLLMEHERMGFVCTGILCFSLMKGISGYGSVLCVEYFEHKISQSFQKDLFSKILSLDLHFFYHNHRGNISSLLLQDVNVLKTSVASALISMINHGLCVFFLLIVMMRNNFFLAFVTFLSFSFILLPFTYFGKKVHKLTGKLQAYSAQLQVFFHQVFQNIMLVKTSNMENQEIASMDSQVNELFLKNMRISRFRALIHPVVELLATVAILVTLLYSALYQNQTPGGFLSFLTALIFIYTPVREMVSLSTKLQGGLAVARRLFSILEKTAPEEVDARSHVSGHSAVPHVPLDFGQPIIFRQVTFSYPEGERNILNDFSATFEGKKRIAIVGISGVGKTSILNLLLRFYHPQKGGIFLGNHDIRTIPLEEWRRNIAFVSQDIMLFDDTVFNNIRYGLQDATHHQVREAAAMAYADTFIEELPQGYDTMIGENGVRLSGGQRQRLVLARAFLRNSPLLLLDEATSSLDSIAEKNVQEALHKLMDNRTTFIVAHRLSTIESVDEIFVFENGAIVEHGKHEELLAKQGAYSRLVSQYALQDSSFPLESDFSEF